jgi:hypothetical protein
MPWRGHNALHCKQCGGHRDEVGPLSARYKCAQCRERRERENRSQLKAHRGPYFEAWRRAVYAEAIKGLVEIGYITEEQRQHLIEEFMRRSRISEARYDIAPGELVRSTKKTVTKPVPASMTERQRRVGAEIRRHYRKARGNIAQAHFLGTLNMDMQRGTARLEAEERATEWVRRHYPDFTPLRVKAARRTDAPTA